ncbi:MAG: LamG domain-containing protein, partial [Planctomycetota bacterium]
QKDVSILPICPTGSALEFDGVNDYVSLSDNAVTTTEFSICAWANHYGPGGGSDGISPILQQSDNSTGDNHSVILFHSENTEGKAVAYIRSSNGSVQKLTGCPRKDYNQWHYYTLTVGSNKLAYYVDAVEVDSAANNQVGDYVTSIDFVDIGRHRYSQVDRGFFNGLIDDVRIYNRALSAEEIQGLMHTRPDTDDPSLVAYWDFDEGQGQVAGDSSGNGNDGTIIGAVWTDSIPPVGICSVEGIVERNLLKVLGMKSDVLDILDEAIGKEDALWEYMDIVFKDRDFGNTSKSDVVKAKQKIHSAIQHEEQAEEAVDKSIDNLDDAMESLDIELPVED